MTLGSVAKRILAHGTDDWVHLAEVEYVARMSLARPNLAATRGRIRTAALEALKQLLDDRLVRIGTVTPTGFEPWELRNEEAIARVAREWTERRLFPGDICWLENTAEGNRIGNEIVRELLELGTWWNDDPHLRTR